MELRGSTDLLSLYDVSQMLSINEATGMLKVESGDTRGYLYFQAGHIINAMDGHHVEGEEAARRVFAMKNAHYSFATELPTVAHRISCTTQNLMMEIARALDEETSAAGTESPAENTQEVQETQEATRHLKEIFTKLDSEARILSLRSPDGIAVADLLEAIRGSPDSVLYLREGAAPEAHSGGRIVPLSQRKLTRSGYDGLRQILFRESEPMSALSESRTERVLSFGERGRYLLDAWKSSGAEIVTIRHLPDPDSLAASLPWPGTVVDALLKEPGSLVLLTGPDGLKLTRVFEALCAHLVKTAGGAFLGFARRWTSGWGAERSTVVLLSTAFPDDLAIAKPMIERLGPAVVATESSDHFEARSIAFHALQRGARAVIGVPAGAVAAAPFRLLDGIDPVLRESYIRYMGLSLTGVLSIPRSPAPAQAWTIQDAARASLLKGDLSSLAHDLFPSSPSRIGLK